MTRCRQLLSVLFLFALLPGGCKQAGPGSKEPNHLIRETSPYLLQHAYNPVGWYPWCEEALARAKAENKLLIVSIGYSACHWCHVMEEESFEDTTVAGIMNRHFISIKVDREERPDIDNIYMDACQLTSPHGCGWPLNVFALPDGKPVWTGSYHPRKAWIDVLKYFVEVYRDNPQKLQKYAGNLSEEIAASGLPVRTADPAEFNLQHLDRYAKDLIGRMDPRLGGVKGAPKFPLPDNQEFLLAWAYHTGNAEALELVKTTLDHLARGGIYDHLGGGFARYSTDEHWKIPHFEKMLYDNAQLVSLYAEAYAATGLSRYKKVARQTLAFVQRELTGPEGEFYCGVDADSEGEEGRYYVWTEREIDSLIGHNRQADLFKAYYQITKNGNWAAGRNVLYAPQPVKVIAGQHGFTSEEAKSIISAISATLLEARQNRPRPRTDDKSLCSWNAMMTRAYCDAFSYLGDPEYLGPAVENGELIRSGMMEENGRLYRNYKNGQPSINAFLDDYGWATLAFIRLYETTFDESWLFAARQTAEYAINHFSARDSVLFYYTSDLDPLLIHRKVEVEDNVIASSNSVMAEGLAILGVYFYDSAYVNRSRAMVRAVSDLLLKSGSPSFYTNWAKVQMDNAYPRYEIAVTGDQAGAVRDSLQQQYLPNVLIMGAERHSRLKLLEGKFAEGRTWIFVCRDKLCKLPVRTVREALDQIKE